MAVNGAVTLDEATLNVNVGIHISGGKKFVIIDNDGTDAVSGTFAGLPNGALFEAGAESFVIYYTADADSADTSGGNDVMLVSAADGTVLIVD